MAVRSPCTRQCFIHAEGNSELDWNRVAVCVFILSLLHMSSFPSAASSFTAEHLLAVVRSSRPKPLTEGKDCLPNLCKKTCGQLKTISVWNPTGAVQLRPLARCVLCSVATVNGWINLCVLRVTVDLEPGMAMAGCVLEWSELRLWEDLLLQEQGGRNAAWVCFQYCVWRLLIRSVVLWGRNTVLGRVWVIHGGQSRQTGVGGEQLFFLAVLGEMDVCHWHVFSSQADLSLPEHRQGGSLLPWRGQTGHVSALGDNIFCHSSFPALHQPTVVLLQNAIFLSWDWYIILSVTKKKWVCVCFLLDVNLMLLKLWDTTVVGDSSCRESSPGDFWAWENVQRATTKIKFTCPWNSEGVFS